MDSAFDFLFVLDPNRVRPAPGAFVIAIHHRQGARCATDRGISFSYQRMLGQTAF
jgi:hypothetical protein